MTAMSVVPPPMAMTMSPAGSVIGRPAPIRAGFGSWAGWPALALPRTPLSRTARRSTCVISDGTPITSRGRRHGALPMAFLTKWMSIVSAASKSAMTPSRSGRTARMLGGVRPSISWASAPTASTVPLAVLKATIDGSLRTMPRPWAKTQVLAVPRSMARSLAKRDMTFMECARAHRMICSASDGAECGRSGHRRRSAVTEPAAIHVFVTSFLPEFREPLLHAARGGEIADALVPPRGGGLGLPPQFRQDGLVPRFVDLPVQRAPARLESSGFLHAPAVAGDEAVPQRASRLHAVMP